MFESFKNPITVTAHKSLDRPNRLDVFYKQAVPFNFAEFHKNMLYHSLLLIKLQVGEHLNTSRTIIFIKNPPNQKSKVSIQISN